MSEQLFQGLCICSTGLELHVKEQIRKIVGACGGSFQDDLAFETTTHLIADAVGSHKQRAAAARGLAVVTSRWVFDCFRAHELLAIDAYRLRVFEGLVVSTTGLAEEAREQVEVLTAQHGGIYDPNLEVGYTNVLIAQRPEGAKYAASIEHGIAVVHISWLHACIDQGVMVDEQAYSLETILQPSRLYHRLDQDLQNAVASLPQLIQQYNAKQGLEHADADWMDLFDGCVFYLLGFRANAESMMQTLIRNGMGTIYREMEVGQVTHVVVSPSLQDLPALEAIEDSVARANAEAAVSCISAHWIVNSIRSSRLEPEALYPVEIDEEHHVEFSTSSSAPAPSLGTLLMMPTPSPPPEPEQDDSMLLDQDSIEPSQPMAEPSTPPASKSTTKFFHGCSFLLLCLDPEKEHEFVRQVKHRGGAQAIALSHHDLEYLDPTQLAQLTHIVVGHGVVLDDQVVARVQQQYAQETAKSSGEGNNSLEDQMTAMAPSPKGRKRRRSRLTLVSDLWLSCCLVAKVAFPHQSHELFAMTVHQTRSMFPIALPLPCFTEVSASTSVYVGVDRVVVMELLRMAGAQVSSKLSKRNTHLICLKPLGMKYEKAKQWKLAIVNARWVVQSMVHGRLLDTLSEEFLVTDEADADSSRSGHGQDSTAAMDTGSQ